MKKKKEKQILRARAWGKRLAAIILVAAMIVSDSSFIAMAKGKTIEEASAKPEISTELEMIAEPEISMESEMTIEGSTEKSDEPVSLPADVMETELTSDNYNLNKEDEFPAIEKLEFQRIPQNTEYIEDVNTSWFTINDLETKVNYSNGETEILQGYNLLTKYNQFLICTVLNKETNEVVTDNRNMKAGSYRVVISFEEKSASYDFTVVKAESKILEIQLEEVITVNENAENVEGGYNYVMFRPEEKGRYQICSDRYLEGYINNDTAQYISGYYNSMDMEAGSVYYIASRLNRYAEEKVTSYTLKVIKLPEIENLELVEDSQNTEYIENVDTQEFSNDVLEIKVNYQNGESEFVRGNPPRLTTKYNEQLEITVRNKETDEEVLYGDYGAMKYGSYNVTISNGEKSAAYDFNVVKAEGRVQEIRLGEKITVDKNGGHYVMFKPKESGRYQVLSNRFMDGYIKAANKIDVDKYLSGSHAEMEMEAENVYYIVSWLNGEFEEEATDYTLEVVKLAEVKSIEVTKEPTQNHMIYGFEKDLNFSGLAVKITYSDGSEGNLAYGSRDKLGYSIQANLVYGAEDLDEFGHLKKGEYQVRVTVGAAEASFQTSVVDLPEDAIKELTEDVETSTVLENFSDSQYFKFTLPEDGCYIVCFNTSVGIYLYDSDLNYMKSEWNRSVILDGIHKNGTYYLKVHFSSSDDYEEEEGRIKVMARKYSEPVKLEIVSNPDKTKYLEDVDDVDMYDVSFKGLSAKIFYKDGTWEIVNYGKGNNKYGMPLYCRLKDEETIDWWLKPGHNVIVVSCQGVSAEIDLEVTKDLSVFQYPALEPGTIYDVALNQEKAEKRFVYTPDKDGAYAFYSTGDHDAYLEWFAPSEDLRGSGTGGYGENGKNFNADLTLKAGVSYLFVVRTSDGDEECTFQVQLEKMPEIQRIDIVKNPEKTSYVYEFEEGIETKGLKIRTLYGDGTEEELEYGKTGKYGKEIQCTWDGELELGTHNVTVSYMGAAASYPIQVISAKDIPMHFLKESESEFWGMDQDTQRVYAKFNPEESGIYYFEMQPFNGGFKGHLYGADYSNLWNFSRSGQIELVKGKTYYVAVEGRGAFDGMALYAENLRTVKSLTIETMPEDTVYYAGINTSTSSMDVMRGFGFNTNGLSARAVYTDGTEEVIPVNERSSQGEMISVQYPEDFGKAAGNYKVKVLYGGAETSFEVKVKDRSQMPSIKEKEAIQQKTIKNPVLQWVQFVPKEDGTYVISRTEKEKRALTCRVLDQEGKPILDTEIYEGSFANALEVELMADETYYIGTMSSSTNERYQNSSYAFRITTMPLVKSIRIQKKGQTTFVHGINDFDAYRSGIEIFAEYEDGTSEMVTEKGGEISRIGFHLQINDQEIVPGSLLPMGESTVKVQFGGKTAEFTVNKISREEKAASLKVLNLGQEVSLTREEPVFKIHTGKGDRYWITGTEYMNVSFYDEQMHMAEKFFYGAEGDVVLEPDKTYCVRGSGAFQNAAVKIEEMGQVKSLKVVAMPRQTEYISGLYNINDRNRNGSWRGLAIEAECSDGTKQKMKIDGNSYGNYTDLLIKEEVKTLENGIALPGTYPVTITYQGVKTQFDITIKEFPGTLSGVLEEGVGQEVPKLLTGEYRIFQFAPKETGYYSFSRLGRSFGTGDLYSEAGKLLERKNSGEGVLSYRCSKGSTYYYAAVVLGAGGDPDGETDTFTLMVNKMTSNSKDPMPISLKDASIQIVVEAKGLVYNGGRIEPKVTVKDKGNLLEAEKDYVIQYVNNINAGTGKILLTGTGRYCETVEKTFTIMPKNCSGANIAAIPDQKYTGKDICPALVVTDGGKVLVLGTDYTVAYLNNKNAGTSMAIITGKGNYTGTKQVSFRIINPVVSVSGVSLDRNSAVIPKGGKLKLTASVKPASASNKAVIWQSSNTKTAAVDNNGNIRGIGIGTAEIIVITKDGNKKTVCKVTVGYGIQYKLNGGTNSKSNPAFHYNKKVKLKNPVRRNYIFKGWYTDRKYKKKITAIGKSDKKNYTLYAKWEKVKAGKPKGLILYNKKAGQLEVKFDKVKGAKGYEIAYAESKNFKKNKKVLQITGNGKKISRLKKKKTYYVKVRGYTLDSTGGKVYGSYSSMKSLKLKK